MVAQVARVHTRGALLQTVAVVLQVGMLPFAGGICTPNLTMMIDMDFIMTPACFSAIVRQTVTITAAVCTAYASQVQQDLTAATATCATCALDGRVESVTKAEAAHSIAATAPRLSAMLRQNQRRSQPSLARPLPPRFGPRIDGMLG